MVKMIMMLLLCLLFMLILLCNNISAAAAAYTHVMYQFQQPVVGGAADFPTAAEQLRVTHATARSADDLGFFVRKKADDYMDQREIISNIHASRSKEDGGPLADNQWVISYPGTRHHVGRGGDGGHDDGIVKDIEDCVSTLTGVTSSPKKADIVVSSPHGDMTAFIRYYANDAESEHDIVHVTLVCPATDCCGFSPSQLRDTSEIILGCMTGKEEAVLLRADVSISLSSLNKDGRDGGGIDALDASVMLMVNPEEKEDHGEGLQWVWLDINQCNFSTVGKDSTAAMTMVKPATATEAAAARGSIEGMKGTAGEILRKSRRKQERHGRVLNAHRSEDERTQPPSPSQNSTLNSTAFITTTTTYPPIFAGTLPPSPSPVPSPAPSPSMSPGPPLPTSPVPSPSPSPAFTQAPAFSTNASTVSTDGPTTTPSTTAPVTPAPTLAATSSNTHDSTPIPAEGPAETPAPTSVFTQATTPAPTWTSTVLSTTTLTPELTLSSTSASSSLPSVAYTSLASLAPSTLSPASLAPISTPPPTPAAASAQSPLTTSSSSPPPPPDDTPGEAVNDVGSTNGGGGGDGGASPAVVAAAVVGAFICVMVIAAISWFGYRRLGDGVRYAACLEDNRDFALKEMDDGHSISTNGGVGGAHGRVSSRRYMPNVRSVDSDWSDVSVI